MTLIQFVESIIKNRAKIRPILPWLVSNAESILDGIYDEAIYNKSHELGKIIGEFTEWAAEKYYPAGVSKFSDIEDILVKASEAYKKEAKTLQNILDGEFIDKTEEDFEDEDEFYDYVNDEMRFQIEDFLHELEVTYGKHLANAFREDMEGIITEYSGRAIVDIDYFDQIWDKFDIEDEATVMTIDVFHYDGVLLSEDEDPRISVIKWMFEEE